MTYISNDFNRFKFKDWEPHQYMEWVEWHSHLRRVWECHLHRRQGWDVACLLQEWEEVDFNCLGFELVGMSMNIVWICY